MHPVLQLFIACCVAFAASLSVIINLGYAPDFVRNGSTVVTKLRSVEIAGCRKTCTKQKLLAFGFHDP